MNRPELDQLVPGLGAFAVGGIYTGSRVIACPPPVDTDLDVVVLLKRDATPAPFLLQQGFHACGGSYISEECYAYRRGDLNLILVNDTESFLRWAASTALARQLNLTSKEERVALFGTVRGGTADAVFESPALDAVLARVLR